MGSKQFMYMLAKVANTGLTQKCPVCHMPCGDPQRCLKEALIKPKDPKFKEYTFTTMDPCEACDRGHLDKVPEDCRAQLSGKNLAEGEETRDPTKQTPWEEMRILVTLGDGGDGLKEGDGGGGDSGNGGGNCNLQEPECDENEEASLHYVPILDHGSKVGQNPRVTRPPGGFSTTTKRTDWLVIYLGVTIVFKVIHSIMLRSVVKTQMEW